MEITQEYLNKRYDYNPDTDNLIYKYNSNKSIDWNERNVGKEVKPILSCGKRYIFVCDSLYSVDQIISILLTGNDITLYKRSLKGLVELQIKDQEALSKMSIKEVEKYLQALDKMPVEEARKELKVKQRYIKKDTSKADKLAEKRALYEALQERNKIAIQDSKPSYHISNYRGGYRIEVYSNGREYFGFSKDIEGALDLVNKYL